MPSEEIFYKPILKQLEEKLVYAREKKAALKKHLPNGKKLPAEYGYWIGCEVALVETMKLITRG